MKFYFINDAYIKYLKQYDNKVLDNYHQTRPYIGILLEINSLKYLAPLSSYKEKQDKLKTSSPTIYKLYQKNMPENKLGMISLNNMIPVLENELHLLDINSCDKKYRTLLNLQLEFIKSHQDSILKKAQKLYELIVIKNHERYTSICCNFSLLESISKTYY